jgi:hypothetical protein
VAESRDLWFLASTSPSVRVPRGTKTFRVYRVPVVVFLDTACIDLAAFIGPLIVV